MNFTAPESLIFWTTLIFIIFFLLLKKLAWKPILTAVKGREESINDALASAEKARKEMRNLQSDNEKLLKEARVEREAMLKEAREIKDKMVADAKDLAQDEANKLIKQAQVAIQSEKQAALAELKNQVASLSIEIAEKVVKGELSDKNKQLKLVEEMLGDATLN